MVAIIFWIPIYGQRRKKKMNQEIGEYIIACIEVNSILTSGQIVKKIDGNFNIEFSRSTIHSILKGIIMLGVSLLKSQKWTKI